MTQVKLKKQHRNRSRILRGAVAALAAVLFALLPFGAANAETEEEAQTVVLVVVEPAALEQTSGETQQAQAETPAPESTPANVESSADAAGRDDAAQVSATPAQTPTEPSAENSTQTIPVANEYLFYSLDEAAAAALCGQYGGVLLRWSDGLGVMYSETSLNGAEGVFYPQEVYLVSSAPYLPQPGETRTNIAAAQGMSTNQGAGVVIAVIDSGVDPDHPALVGKIADAVSVIPESAYGDGGYFWTEYQGVQDNEGHGSHIAGILVGQTDEMTIGIAPEAQILSIKALEKYGLSAAGTTEWMIRAILYAISQKVDIINLSIGGGKNYVSAAQTALKQASDAGILVVCATGNSYTGPTEGIDYPAAYENTLAVTSVTIDGKDIALSDFSRYGTGTDLSAPGVSIFSCNASGQYQTLSGTSMSCAIVSGVAALLLSEKPDLTPAEASRILKQSATDAGSDGYDTVYGWGVVNAEAALLLLKNGKHINADDSTGEMPKPAVPGGPETLAANDWLQTQLDEQQTLQQPADGAENTLKTPENGGAFALIMAIAALLLAFFGVRALLRLRPGKRAAQ